MDEESSVVITPSVDRDDTVVIKDHEPGSPSTGTNRPGHRLRVMSDNSDSMAPPAFGHLRQQSVGNSLPMPYLAKLPSLIALVDQTTEQGLRSRRESLSSRTAPATLSLHATQSDGSRNNSQSGIMMGSFDIPETVASHGRRTSEEMDMYTLAIEAQQQLTALVTEKEEAHRENLRLQVQLEDMQSRVRELEEMMDVNAQGEDDMARSQSMLNRRLMEREDMVEKLRAELDHVRHAKAEAETMLTLSITEAELMATKRSAHSREPSGSGFVDDQQQRDAVAQKEENLRLKSELEQLRKNFRMMEKEYEKERDNVEHLVEQVVSKEEEIKLLQEDNTIKDEEMRTKEMDYMQIEEHNAQLQSRVRSLTTEKTLAEQQEEQLRQQVADQEMIIEDMKTEQDALVRVVHQQQNDKLQEDDHLFSLLRDLRQQTARPQSYTQFSDEFVNELQEKTQTEMSETESNLLFMLGSGNEPSVLPSVRILNLDRYESTPGPGMETIDSDAEMDEKQQMEDAEQDAAIAAVMAPEKATDKGQSPKAKEENKKKKKLEIAKASAEQEFFFLTCLSVKMNLVEEYPDKPAILEEDVISLWKLVQEESVPMNKFAAWVDAHLRGKYDLPQLYRATAFHMPNLQLPKIQMDKIHQARIRAAETLSSYTRKAVESAHSLAERVRTPSTAPPSGVPPPIEEGNPELEEGEGRAVVERKGSSYLGFPDIEEVPSASSRVSESKDTDSKMPAGEEEPPPPQTGTCANCVIM